MAARVAARVPGLRLVYPGQTAADIPAAVTSLLDVTADCDDRADPEAWIEAVALRGCQPRVRDGADR